MKTLTLVIIIAFIFFSEINYSQNVILNRNAFYPGETLVYKVKWTFIRIGTITIKTYACENNPDCVKVSMLVVSNPSIPFLNIKEYNESIIDRQTCMSNHYYGSYNDDDLTEYTVAYNPSARRAVWKSYAPFKHLTLDSLTINNCPRYVDGPALFFYTRTSSGYSHTINVPTMINGKVENTKLEFTDDKEEVELDGVENPVIARQYYGYADWEGGSSQSLSGEFSGLVSDDTAAIPVYAEVKVLLGKIKIELESWDRGNWNKPSDTAAK